MITDIITASVWSAELLSLSSLFNTIVVKTESTKHFIYYIIIIIILHLHLIYMSEKQTQNLQNKNHGGRRHTFPMRFRSGPELHFHSHRPNLRFLQCSNQLSSKQFKPNSQLQRVPSQPLRFSPSPFSTAPQVGPSLVRH